MPVQKLPRWTAVWTRVAGVAVSMGACVGTFFVLNHSDGLGGPLAQALAAYLVVFVVAIVPISMWAAAPLSRLQRQLDDGVAAPQLLPRDVIDALRLPQRIFAVTAALGTVLALAILAATFVVDDLAPYRWIGGVGGTAIGFISATMQGYVMDKLVRRRVAPVVLRHGRLDHLGEVWHVQTYHHLTLLITNLGIMWPAIAAVLVLTDTRHVPIAAAPLVLLYVVTGTVEVIGILIAISRNVGHLKERLAEVRDGNLDVQARTDGLDSFGIVMSDFNRMVEGLRQREQLKETFGRYVTTQVADEILSGRVTLGGELRTATVLFSDIRGFTSMSEQLGPTEVVAFLNEYLTAMVDCVLEHGGVLDKFIGDAVLAVFGAPVGTGSIEGDARAAVACAVSMGKRLTEMNERRVAVGKPAIGIGIGVHTGELVAGNIGSPRRMQYTVIGDTVNVGSRLESLTKEHRRQTLMSAATARLVEKDIDLVEVGTVTVRGRSEPLQIYGLKHEVRVSTSPGMPIVTAQIAASPTATPTTTA